VSPSLIATVEQMAAQTRCQTVVSDEPLTASTYNIKSGRAGGLTRILGVMRRANAEVYLLQEVDNHRRSTGNIDQAGWFASQLGGWHYAFGRNVTFGDGLYGTAVVSKFPIISWTNTPLPNINHSQPRGLLHVVINFHGTEVSIYSTHLDNTSGANRLRQASTISQILAGDPRPKILGGDMNTWPGSAPDRVLASRLSDTWEVAGAGKGATHPAGHPRTRIDFLMYGGPGLRAVSAVVLPDTASDHLAVRAQYELDGIKTVKCTRK
jgi:endonuclease/exonuclease/phosphatase family metal-dependent hydrolase